jgi:hypothetical protein
MTALRMLRLKYFGGKQVKKCSRAAMASWLSFGSCLGGLDFAAVADL